MYYIAIYHNTGVTIRIVTQKNDSQYVSSLYNILYYTQTANYKIYKNSISGFFYGWVMAEGLKQWLQQCAARGVSKILGSPVQHWYPPH